jgi:RimJ/RimL family protein N-acetyltransferase
MPISDVVLQGTEVRLEPLAHHHIDGLVLATAVDPSLYVWSPVPQGAAAAAQYVETASAWRNAGTAVPFAIIRLADSAVVGCTRFWNLERWTWPRDHPRYGRAAPDACEIGYTWLTRSAIRTAVNTETKLLLLTHAFGDWQVFRVCFHADLRNERSSKALERLGARREGILRAHRIAIDYIPRDSVRYSIVDSDWPEVRDGLCRRLARPLPIPQQKK